MSNEETINIVNLLINNKNIKILLGRSGFAVKEIKTYYCYYEVRDVLSRLQVYFKNSFVKQVFKWAAKFCPNWMIKIPTNEMVVIAEKSI